MLEELREKAKFKQIEVHNDKNATERDKRFADSIVEVFNKEESINQIPGSTVLAMFRFLNLEGNIIDYEDRYYKLKEEINKKYIYVDSEDLKMKK